MRNKMTDVTAVIVSHNRKEWLIECIDAIKRQSRKVEKIIVVDNDSSDGTREWLGDQLDLDIIYQGNLGGAGGFESGIRAAHENGSTWIWCLDDDVEPIESALDTMLAYSDISKCINTNKIDLDGNVIELGGFMGLLHTNNDFNKVEGNCVQSKSDWSDFRGACFEGMLIHRDVVASTGYPLGDFFIAGDDTLFGLLASLHTKVILVKKPLLIKKGVRKIKNKPFFGTVTFHSNFYLYHVIRNSFVVKNLLVARFNRNQFDLVSKILIYSLKSLMRSIFIKEMPLEQVWIVMRGVRDGIKFSKKYNPNYFLER
tara:strand:+ start:140 stop:1078 length:939 start_codon:yes stop_codon:yes gene_type:complete